MDFLALLDSCLYLGKQTELEVTSTSLDYGDVVFIERGSTTRSFKIKMHNKDIGEILLDVT